MDVVKHSYVMPFAALAKLCPALPYGSAEAAQEMLGKFRLVNNVPPQTRLSYELDPIQQRVLVFVE